MKILFSHIILILLAISLAAQSPGDEDSGMVNKAKHRDQRAIDEAVNGWWTASMKAHDRRIQWWKEAKFGMFIHWGIYSLPGGEWKGQKISGYSEHLMRKEKILRKEYLDLAHQFNPLRFNAEEWILNAKKAGMKYFIITAKHHDGFALYNSAVSDFDIWDQTPFKRDPLAELAAAARKHGLKFGFYYSHAFDWEHPSAPGNDWEYNNPGGDKNLYGGRNWYDLQAGLLSKAKKYVDEKAIPQIKELLTNYHPDILWFDTPHKLPLSENIRILKAIRETDSNVVVNGRLARSPARNFGDYLNTADRPAEFYPVTGDWEAIPTTNESYGYHRFDSSHKPVSHFIQLLATAASRGGNLLMNIGPKGDGVFDERDLEILSGIGHWMEKYGGSIYDSKASPLPLQNWGVSTLKENKLYLHVFNWPEDGKLYLHGLLSEINKVYPLLDPLEELPVKYLPSGDFLLTLPGKRGDSINAVLVLEWKGKLATGSGYLLTPNSQINRLLAFDAIQTGKGFSYGDGKTNRYYVEGWKSIDQNLAWHFNTIRTGEYRMHIKYLAPEETSGGSCSLSFYRNTIETTKLEKAFQFRALTTPGNTSVITQDIGVVSLQTGSYNLVMNVDAIQKLELMKLLEVQLIPIDKK
ncbi:MAG TPA: alpha-L-fucosidase [Chitinophagaceae bacterium]|nr:alpha-L-fucosidase [Chitinophagaceae bacterium]